MKRSSRVKFWKGRGLLLALSALAGSCADKAGNPSTPAAAGHQGLQERLSEGGGYKQDANGQWVPKSDKRSSFDSQRDSPFSKGKVEKQQYKTGDYAKKTWWGSKEFGTKGYEGNTDGSRFQTKALQDGMVSRDNGKSARETGGYKTNTLGKQESAWESSVSPVDRPLDAAVQSRRGVYKAPSIIDWREQRSMSIEQSKGILGR